MTPDLRSRIQQSLGSAYGIERELGGGAMSRVFVAHEPALNRHVVIKVLSPDLAEGLSAERFTREVLLVAQLQHPNIVPVFTAGASDGLPYFVMPYVQGESLRTMMGHGPLTSKRAIPILRDVAKALAYAHEHGVVHRDIKPDNVLVSHDTAMVTDFGIAKALNVAGTHTRSGALTNAGITLGTPAYMAPEQAAGDPAIDHRADLYAWGMLAYEMLAGEHAFGAKRGMQQLIAAQLTEHPVSLSEKTSAVPTALAELIMRCLAKDP
ncbi:MAG: serine/threonine-protein kinase, partial [Gemmatimonadota bacterium]